MSNVTMKNILLLRPPSGMGKVLPIGLMALGTYIKITCPDVAVKLLDFRLSSPIGWDQVRKHLSEVKADIIGITSLSIEVKEALALARLCRELYPNASIIIGGPLASVEHSLLDSFDEIDRIVVGEGEEILRSIVCDTISDSRKVLFASDFPVVDLNVVPMPDYSLIDLHDYFRMESHEAFQINRRYVPIFTSRGCPFDCGFCFHVFGKTVRFRNIENVCNEVEYLVQTYGIKEIHIEDDVFNINRERALEFFNFLNSRKIHLAVSFPNGIIYKNIDDEFVRVLKENGVYRVCFGIESTAPRIMELISKKHDLTKLSEAIRLFRKYRILTHGFFINGFPTETKDDLQETLRFILKSSLHTFRFSRYTPFKGTPLYSRFKQVFGDGSLDEVNVVLYHEDGGMYYSEVPANVIQSMIQRTTLRFYFNPFRIMNIILALDIRVFFRTLFKAYRYFTTGQVKRSKP